MGKFYGKVGFAETQKTAPGVWKEVIVERDYYGDFLRLTSRWQSSENLNDNLVFNNQISIVADSYADEHFSAIRFVRMDGVPWKVTLVDPQRPRIILNVGGIYNEQIGTSS